MRGQHLCSQSQVHIVATYEDVADLLIPSDLGLGILEVSRHLDGRLLVLFAFPRRSIHLLRRQFEIDHLILERYLVAHDARCLRS